MTSEAQRRSLAEKTGLLPEEIQRIEEALGRSPNAVELALFSVLWSEHCCYKNSKRELRKFPTEGPGVLIRAGEENAGALDIGDGWAVVFKIESHNHPSAVEPFQGAATGVGGILRDIYTMGARPICFLDSLRLGEIRSRDPAARNNRRLLRGIVGGIAHYGNCVGIPTVGGELVFDPAYNGNPLVNVFCAGVVRHDRIQKGAASGVGNPVYVAGSRTGRDGLKGAAFASRLLGADAREDRPAVQVGDPFMGKILMEACLELFARPGVVVGVQDMGAAGIGCSTSETAARGGVGMEIDLDQVPLREAEMDAAEILLSESQERMLLILRKGREEEAEAVFAKWGVPLRRIGTVTGDGLLRYRRNGAVAAELPARLLTEDAPVYERQAKLPVRSSSPVPPRPSLSLAECRSAWLALAALPSLASKEWVWRQYDWMVGIRTVVGPGRADAAVLRLVLDGRNKFLAFTVDGNARFAALDPYTGGRAAVAEAVRNLAVTGARPLGITDNLNFGDPYRPEAFGELRGAVEGMAEACRAFGLPVTGGNVSLYNESPAGAILPTPVVAAVGLIGRQEEIIPMGFQREGELLYLLGGWGSGIAGSAYAWELLGWREGAAPEVCLPAEIALASALRSLGARGIVASAHDLSDGGLAIALLECALAGEGRLGAEISLPSSPSAEELLFGESPGRVLLTVAAEAGPAVEEECMRRGVEARRIGRVAGSGFRIDRGPERMEIEVKELERIWRGALPALMDPQAEFA
ncbi:Phosphoribosylformylglycinamidine synthase subunit PurL [Methylacidimicrobium sp. AP8]|uniref:phosphoribosylformylglycinamidine synthase subunit PurL n=1 Tax=Methylacidimicrobium sp. AP8 TaxID=2730359 RepID=UPI0018C04409|nr:phosphoribosylformylglycinamidine synthase subunit PurL [Methylacidimicrobium sp. AP8]CAB4242863.1 Phosphoribosylformylglycinamidine synthase subunit PurL [Methylacidimicrobium sp. AP8]